VSKHYCPPDHPKVAIAEAWNERYPPGTAVDLTDDLGVVHRTRTRSEAWCLGHGEPVVAVEGRSGSYLLERIKPVEVVP
jgi:hypothetical protein